MTEIAPSIVVVGSLHYDIMVDSPHRPEKGETVAGSRWYPKFGGKGGNQAVAARAVGCPVRMLGAVGEDDFGTYLLDALTAGGVDAARVRRIPGTASGISVAITDAEGDYGAVIVSGANLTIDAAALKDATLWAGATVLILQNEVPEAINIAAARAARAQGVLVCLNAAPAREMSGDLWALLDVLVVNAVEARDLCGITVDSLADAARAAHALAERVPVAVVTAGGDGVAYAQTFGPSGMEKAIPVTLVSSHGAGDVFVGALSSELAKGSDIQHAVVQANLRAAHHVSRSSDRI